MNSWLFHEQNLVINKFMHIFILIDSTVRQKKRLACKILNQTATQEIQEIQIRQAKSLSCKTGRLVRAAYIVVTSQWHRVIAEIFETN